MENRQHPMKLTENDFKYIIETAVYLLTEDVFADKNKINKKNKTIGLTYNKNAARNYGNAKKTDMLKTDKMDKANSDTYEVTLKGGVTAYNITDIKGLEVMHYFKEKFQNAKTEIAIKDGDETEMYKLLMDDADFRDFMDTFIKKVEFVIQHFITKNNIIQDEIIGISLYPVASSSNFNMSIVTNFLTHMNILNLPIQTIDENLLLKDVRNLERDDDFINKNKDFYNSSFTQNNLPEYGTVSNQVDNAIERYYALKNLPIFIENANLYFNEIMKIYNRRTVNKNGITEKTLQKLAECFKAYFDNIYSCLTLSYNDVVSGEEKHFQKKSILVQKKYSKGPSIDNRSNVIWNLVKPLIANEISDVTGKPYKVIDICEWEPKKFQIKKLQDSVRMGLKNMYNPNTDEELVNNQVNKAKNTIFVIFDDNISGGSTLSDICYQCKELGIENVLPITFGTMAKSETIGVIKLNSPENGYNF